MIFFDEWLPSQFGSLKKKLLVWCKIKALSEWYPLTQLRVFEKQYKSRRLQVILTHILFHKFPSYQSL